MTEAVNNVTSADGTTYTAKRTTGGLGKDDFLRLLTTQLANQDPMNPANEQEMVGTLAQFTALEQTGKLADSMADLTKANQWSHGESLLGRNILGKDAAGANVYGVVHGIRLEKDNIFLHLDNNQDLPISGLLEVLG